MLDIPPTTTDLADLKQELQYAGKQLAELFGLTGDHQWRMYPGGNAPRPVSPQVLFFATGRLELDEKTINRVLKRMRTIGAVIDQDAEASVMASQSE